MSVVRTCLLALVPCAPRPRGWAKHDKRARELHAAIDDLNRAVDQLPDGSTLASAQEKIQDKRARSANAACAFSQTYLLDGVVERRDATNGAHDHSREPTDAAPETPRGDRHPGLLGP